jgi:hypothetical protein
LFLCAVAYADLRNLEAVTPKFNFQFVKKNSFLFILCFFSIEKYFYQNQLIFNVTKWFIQLNKWHLLLKVVSSTGGRSMVNGRVVFSL